MAVTAYPVVLVDSTAGGASDSAASGAGPSTALTGTAGATNGAGTTVTLDSGTVLTGVATDGSHVIYFADTTAGHRRFAAINATAGSGGATPTVTVEQALTISLSGKSWAIGGKRATVASATSLLLFDNNSSAGDAMPGWTIEMQSGHSETISTSINCRRGGDTTSGPIILRGTAGAGTLPKLRVTADVAGIQPRSGAMQFRGFEVSAESAAVTAAVSDPSLNGGYVVDGLKLTRTSANKFTTGVSGASGWGGAVVNCEIAFCTTGVNLAEQGLVRGNYIHDCTGAGVSLTTGTVAGNVIAACQDGVNSTFAGAGSRSLLVDGNTIDSCTRDGVRLSGTFSVNPSPLVVTNNILSRNGGYGLNFSGGQSAAALSAVGFTIVCNDTFSNTSGPYNPASVGSSDPGLDPQFTNSAGNNYSIGTNLKAKGYPVGGTLAVGTTSSTYSYVDPGAAQRQEPTANPPRTGKVVSSIGTY